MNERMNAILDVLEPQRSEKGTGLRKVTEAKEKLARGLGEPGKGVGEAEDFGNCSG